MAQKVVDSDHGTLMISDDFVISSHTRKEDILSYFGANKVTIRDMNNGWMHYNVKDIFIDSTPYAFTFYFNTEDLKSISFVFDYSPDESWNNWSLERELKRLNQYTTWLKGQLGEQTSFPWGEAGAFFDSKGGFSDIFLRYL